MRKLKTDYVKFEFGSRKTEEDSKNAIHPVTGSSPDHSDSGAENPIAYIYILGEDAHWDLHHLKSEGKCGISALCHILTTCQSNGLFFSLEVRPGHSLPEDVTGAY